MVNATSPAGESVIHRALRGTASAASPAEGAKALLDACVKHLTGTGGSIYTLDLATGSYSRVASLPTEPSEGAAIPASRLSIPESRIATVAEFLAASEEYAGYEELLPDGVVFFAMRNETCVGAIRIDGPRPGEIDPAGMEDLIACADLLVTVYEDAFSFQLLESLQDPLDFTRSEREFFRTIADLITDSAGMEFVALRELDEGALRCIALAGFEDADPNEYAGWDLDPVDKFPAFARALEGKNGNTVAVTSIDDPEHAELRALPWCVDVKSFVAIPVLVGRKTFGVLSVGARCEFEYAPIELRGFESIANGVGVSISNFRNSHLLNRRVGEYVAAASAITSIEVARSARHEASNEIEVSTQALHRLLHKAGKSCQKEAEKVENHLHGVRLALKKMKVATTQPESDWETISIAELWAQANTAVATRLQDAKVEVRSPLVDVKVLARQDWLRQVFLNLLLNSIDAFNEGSKRTDRRIELLIDRPSARDSEYRLTYSDTAGGVIPQRLRPPPGEEEMSVQQLIFLGGVTSKKRGSGYGLWLARKIVDDHFGSIDLADYRKGVTFVIHLPTPAEAKERMKEEGP